MHIIPESSHHNLENNTLGNTGEVNSENSQQDIARYFWCTIISLRLVGLKHMFTISKMNSNNAEKKFISSEIQQKTHQKSQESEMGSLPHLPSGIDEGFDMR
jgi:hypothetical protein